MAACRVVKADFVRVDAGGKVVGAMPVARGHYQVADELPSPSPPARALEEVSRSPGRRDDVGLGALRRSLAAADIPRRAEFEQGVLEPDLIFQREEGAAR